MGENTVNLVLSACHDHKAAVSRTLESNCVGKLLM